MDSISLFEKSPVPLWEKNLSETKKTIDEISAKIGLDNLMDYLSCHPFVVQDLASKMKIINVNQKTIEMVKAKNKEDVINNLDRLFTADSYQTLKRELVALANKQDFEEESSILSFDGEIIPILVAAHFPENGDFSSVITHTIDMRTIIKHHKDIEILSLKYQNLIELTGTAFLILNDKWEAVEMNSKFKEIINLKDESKMIGKDIRKWINTETILNFNCAIEELNKGFCPQSIELLMDLKTDKTGNGLKRNNSIWLNFILSKVDSGQKIIFCLVQDISKKKFIEKKKFISDQKNKDKLKQSLYKIRQQIEEMGVKHVI